MKITTPHMASFGIEGWRELGRGGRRLSSCSRYTSPSKFYSKKARREGCYFVAVPCNRATDFADHDVLGLGFEPTGFWTAMWVSPYLGNPRTPLVYAFEHECDAVQMKLIL